MQLTLWTYEGPPHVGAMRVATAMQGLHYVLHAPQGDTYADLLFTMIERRGARPPVTYTTFQARDLGGDTAELFKTSAARRIRAFRAASHDRRRILHSRAHSGRPGRPRQGSQPADPGHCAWNCRPIRKKKTGARRRPSIGSRAIFAGQRRGSQLPERSQAATYSARRRSASVIATTCAKSPACSAPRRRSARGGSARSDASRSRPTRRSRLQRRALSRDRIAGGPMAGKEPWAAVHENHAPGRCATREFIAEVACLAGVDPAPVLNDENSRLPWYSRSVDSTYLSGKRVFIFGDATHAIGGGPDRSKRTWLQSRRSGNLCSRIRTRSARGGEALWSRGADH